jgi:hypothetical protein
MPETASSEELPCNLIYWFNGEAGNHINMYTNGKRDKGDEGFRNEINYSPLNFNGLFQ